MKTLDIFNEKPEPTTIRIPKKLLNELKKDARKNGRTIGKHLTSLLADVYYGKE